MKKVLLFFLLFFRLVTFGDIKSDTSRLIEKREVVGEGYQNVDYLTNNFKITGLGGYDKLIYEFESFGNDFFKKNHMLEPRIKIKQMWIEPLDATIDTNNKVILGFNGNCNLRIRTVVGVRNGSRLSGKYTSYPIILILKGKRKNSSSYDRIMIEVRMELDIVKTLKISTTPMDLGVGVQGQMLSSSHGNHGYLNIEGEPNRNVVINYPREVEMFNKMGKGSIKVEISSPDLYFTGNEEYSTRLSERGEKKVTFFGQVRDTKKAVPGKYSGDLKIKVRYN